MTHVDFDRITVLDHERVIRAAAFAHRVSYLNRNRNHVGELHQPVTLVTDRLSRVKEHRSSCDFFKNQETFLGTCWNGSTNHPGTVIWLNAEQPRTNVPRLHTDLVETLTHELAHAATRGRHNWTFRRMYALLLPHIFELFDEHWQWDRVTQIIRRYQVDYDTSRLIGHRRDIINVVDADDRRIEEADAHRTASGRFRARLDRLGVRP